MVEFVVVFGSGDEFAVVFVVFIVEDDDKTFTHIEVCVSLNE